MGVLSIFLVSAPERPNTTKEKLEGKTPEDNTIKQKTRKVRRDFLILFIVFASESHSSILQNVFELQKKRFKMAFKIKIITLNIAGLNNPVKRHRRISKMSRKEKAGLVCLQENHLRICEENYFKEVFRGTTYAFLLYTYHEAY